MIYFFGTDIVHLYHGQLSLNHFLPKFTSNHIEYIPTIKKIENTQIGVVGQFPVAIRTPEYTKTLPQKLVGCMMLCA